MIKNSALQKVKYATAYKIAMIIQTNLFAVTTDLVVVSKIVFTRGNSDSDESDSDESSDESSDKSSEGSGQ